MPQSRLSAQGKPEKLSSVADEVRDLSHTTNGLSKKIRTSITRVAAGVRQNKEKLKDIASLKIDDFMKSKDKVTEAHSLLSTHNEYYTDVLRKVEGEIDKVAELAQTLQHENATDINKSSELHQMLDLINGMQTMLKKMEGSNPHELYDHHAS